MRARVCACACACVCACVHVCVSLCLSVSLNDITGFDLACLQHGKLLGESIVIIFFLQKENRNVE